MEPVETWVDFQPPLEAAVQNGNASVERLG
jgi:hypothetical protein